MFELIDNLIHVLESRSIEYTVELRDGELDIYFNPNCVSCKVRYYPEEKHLTLEEHNGNVIHFDDKVIMACNGDYLIFAGDYNMYHIRLAQNYKPKDIVVD